MKEWYSAAEIASRALHGLPATKQGVINAAERENWSSRRDVNGRLLVRRRKGRGGGWEYHYSVLPMEAQAALIARERPAPAEPEPAERADKISAERWQWFDRLPETRKKKARHRRSVLEAVEALRRAGAQKDIAVNQIARLEGISPRSIYNWFDLVAGVEQADWAPLLTPRHEGRTVRSHCDPDAWEFLKKDYLRQSKPSFTSCHERLKRAAVEQGWTIPSARTLQRRVDALWNTIRVYHREGPEALARLYPAMERDRSTLHAMEAVNADCHTVDVRVIWPGLKDPVRPTLIAVQDLYSNKIVGWRMDLSPNATAVRLVFYDVFREFGIPDHAVLDNGREFAAKMLTGQQPSRFRFKVDPEETVGILTELDVQVHWALPYHGQSKPIERAFRDLCDSIAKHPAFEGAYTGNSTTNKPENYGSRAVPLDRFMEIYEQGIALHNARVGRNTKVCAGVRSFDQAFEDSYRDAIIRRARPEQLRFCMLAAENVTARKPSGAVHLHGNRYWADWMTNLIGQKLTAKYDPDDLHSGIELYRADGAYIGPAPCWEAAGFFSVDDARDNARTKRAWTNAQRAMAAAERAMGDQHLQALIAKIDTPEPPEPRVIRPVIGAGNTALRLQPDRDPETDIERYDDVLEASVARLADFRREQN